MTLLRRKSDSSTHLVPPILHQEAGRHLSFEAAETLEPDPLVLNL